MVSQAVPWVDGCLAATVFLNRHKSTFFDWLFSASVRLPIGRLM